MIATMHRPCGCAVPDSVSHALFPSLFAFITSVLLLLCLFVSAPHAEQAKEITESIKAQKTKAKNAESALTQLTEKERALHKELADAADRIQLLERDVNSQENALESIEQKRTAAEQDHGQLVKKLKATENELEKLMNAMWPLYVESRAGRGANMPDWHEADRHFEWASKIYAAIDEQNRMLAEQEKDIVAIVQKQNALEQAARERLATVNKSKDRLLRDKLQYNSKLQSVRKQKEDAEATLKNVLSVIKNLNYRLEDMDKAEGPFALIKGSLPWPAKGMLALHYAPDADPPTRGIGMALVSGTEIRTVASGKVVHNDILRGFGRVVIIMHDAAYYSLYAYLTDSPLTVGQDVKKGQTIGTAGYFPRVEGPGLYFELRFHQKAINPEPWLTALN